MTPRAELCTLSEKEIAGLEVHAAGAVDLRRDLHVFLRYVEANGLTRTVRGNGIPKADAKKLARLVSYAQETEAVEEENGGFWSNFVSHVALGLGLVKFKTEGEYRGYSSTTESFPDNDVKLMHSSWKTFLGRTAVQKERSILAHLIASSGSEFFERATLVDGEAFNTRGSATGPASRMKLPAIRKRLLELLSGLAPDIWYDTSDFVELVRREAPTAILDPATREADHESKRALQDWEWHKKYGNSSFGRQKPVKPGPVARPTIRLEDIYTNFQEHDPEDRWSEKGTTQITSAMADGFCRVEGRYIEWFLREIPFLSGFVSLAYRNEKDRHGMDTSPPRQRLRAFRTTRKLAQVLGNSPDLDRVKITVLPSFEVVIEALSYPESTLDQLAPFTVPVSEDRPVYRLRLEKRRVLDTAASQPDATPITTILDQLTGVPLPANVAAELADWTSRGDKVVFYEDLTLLEIRGGASRKDAVLATIRDRVVDDRPEGFAIVRDPGRTTLDLERAGHVPVRVRHPEDRLDGRHGVALALATGSAPPVRSARPKPPTERRTARLVAEDMIGYRCSDTLLLAELIQALSGRATTCESPDGSVLLVIPAARLPDLRAAIRRLGDRFDVQL